MTRILQLGKFYPIHGGVEKVMMIFTEGLDERGYSCDMLCASHDGEVDDIILSERSASCAPIRWSRRQRR